MAFVAYSMVSVLFIVYNFAYAYMYDQDFDVDCSDNVGIYTLG